MKHLPALALLAALALACNSGGATSSMIPQCPGLSLPTALTLTVSGFTTCTCLNGTFPLLQSTTGLWSSGSITGCPGQTQTAYFKLLADQSTISGNDGLSGGAAADAGPDANVGIGITDAQSMPGSGDSDLSVATALTCSPFTVHGSGSRAGNINGFCSGGEDGAMVWSITQ
jgi:hypothetical protein